MHFVYFEMEICIKTGKILFTFPQEKGFEMVLIISTVSPVPKHTHALNHRHSVIHSLTHLLTHGLV